MRLSMSPCQVSLNSPPNRTDPFPSIRLSNFPLAFVLFTEPSCVQIHMALFAEHQCLALPLHHLWTEPVRLCTCIYPRFCFGLCCSMRSIYSDIKRGKKFHILQIKLHIHLRKTPLLSASRISSRARGDNSWTFSRRSEIRKSISSPALRSGAAARRS